MNLDLLKRAGLDRYDFNARLRPALFVLLPALILVTFWLPAARTFMGSIVTLLSACGLTYLLAQVARRRGRAAERALGDRAGRRHSARLLTHTDTTIAAPTKARYHAYLRASGGLELSTSEEEAQDASLAYDRARSAVDWLLEHTRPSAKASLLFDDNIAYGFQRNLYGMKLLGVAIAVLCLVANAGLLWLRPLDDSQFWTAALLECGISALIFLWLSQVSAGSVEDASLAYAQKLFAQCERIARAAADEQKRQRAKKDSGTTAP